MVYCAPAGEAASPPRAAPVLFGFETAAAPPPAPPPAAEFPPPFLAQEPAANAMAEAASAKVQVAILMVLRLRRRSTGCESGDILPASGWNIARTGPRVNSRHRARCVSFPGRLRAARKVGARGRDSWV